MNYSTTGPTQHPVPADQHGDTITTAELKLQVDDVTEYSDLQFPRFSLVQFSSGSDNRLVRLSNCDGIFIRELECTVIVEKSITLQLQVS